MSRTTQIEAAFRELVYPGSAIFDPLEIVDRARYSSHLPVGAAQLTLSYDGRLYPFALEIAHRSAPSVALPKIARLVEVSAEALPLLLVPFLTDDLVKMLKEAGISGADLAGNYVFSTDSLVAIRRDRRNEFPEDTGIRNIYRGTSSIVCRFLLSRPEVFESVNSIHTGIRQCGGEVSLSTVSKVLSALADDLLIEKSRNRIRIVQAARMLDKLTENYSSPAQDGPPELLRIQGDGAEREKTIEDILGTDAWIWDGSTSATQHLGLPMPRLPVVLVRARDLMSLVVIPDVVARDSRFPNVAIRYTNDREPFFRCDPNGHRASVLEAYLSWSRLDKRERELAGELRNRILEPFDSYTQDQGSIDGQI